MFASADRFHEQSIKIILLNALLFFLFGVVAIIARWVTIAHFTTEVGANYLPDIFSASAIIHFIIAAYIVFNFSKHDILQFLTWIMLACFVTMALGFSLLYTNISQQSSATTLILMGTRIASVIEMIMWICAAQFFTGLTAKSIYGYLIGANAAGNAVGSTLLIILSGVLDTAAYIAICTVGLLMSFIVVCVLKNSKRGSGKPQSESLKFLPLLKYLSYSKMWGLILFFAVIIYCLYYVSNFQFIIAAQLHFENLNHLTRFFGYFELVSAILIVAFAMLMYRIISSFGVWWANDLAILVAGFSFFILFLAGTHIYYVSVSRIISLLCFKLSLVAIGVICKHVKEKYQSVMISLFDFVPVSVGTFIAGLLGYILTWGYLSYQQFSLFMMILSIFAFIAFMLAKSSYIKVLISGIEDETYAELTKRNPKIIAELLTANALYDSIEKSKKEDTEYNDLSYELPVKIKDQYTVKMLLNNLMGLNHIDSTSKLKALRSLVRFKELGNILTPFIVKLLEDRDINVRAKAIMMLHEFDPVLALNHAKVILNHLLESEQVASLLLALEIISLFKLKDQEKILITAMVHPEAHIRKLAYCAFGNICEVDDDKAIAVFRAHLGEQNNGAYKALLDAIYDAVVNKRKNFYEFIFSADPFVWRNVSELLIKWRCITECQYIILSAVNKLHLVYENLESIQKILHISDSLYADILTQHLVLQNEVILKGAIFIAAMNSYDEVILDSLYQQIRKAASNERATALEVIENFGDKRLTKHIISYFTQDSTAKRSEYARKVWRIEDANLHSTFTALLQEHNEWINVCTLRLIADLGDPQYEIYLHEKANNETNLFVQSYAKITLRHLQLEKTMKIGKQRIDYLDIIVALKHSRLFKEVNLNSLAIFSKSLIEKRFKANEIVIAQGATLDGFYILYEGSVNINKELAEKTAFIMELSELAILGAQYMINESASNELYLAKTDVTAFFVAKSLYKNMLVLNPEIAQGMLEEICKYSIQYQEHLTKRRQ